MTLSPNFDQMPPEQLRALAAQALNGHDPYAYLKDVLTRLPTQRASGIGQLLSPQWMPA